MAENGERKAYDVEVGSVGEERRKKRMKCYAYVAAFAVFQTAVILVFALVVMKVRTPKFRVRSATFEDFQASTLTTNASFSTTFEDFQASTLTTNASFSTRMIAELSVKNANFGRYKYQNSTIEFFYQDYKVGEAEVPRGKANFKSTKKFIVPVNLNSANVPGDVLGNELSQHAWIPLTSRATLKGKVTLMLIFKKNKSTNMHCTMNLNTSSKQLQDLSCR